MKILAMVEIEDYDVSDGKPVLPDFMKLEGYEDKTVFLKIDHSRGDLAEISEEMYELLTRIYQQGKVLAEDFQLIAKLCHKFDFTIGDVD